MNDYNCIHRQQAKEENDGIAMWPMNVFLDLVTEHQKLKESFENLNI
jgi:hypothetical protein